MECTLSEALLSNFCFTSGQFQLALHSRNLNLAMQVILFASVYGFYGSVLICLLHLACVLVCMFVFVNGAYLSACISVCVCLCLYIYLSISLPVCLSIYMSVSVCLSLSACLSSVCLLVFCFYLAFCLTEELQEF